jgi:hypothetical protein
MADAMSSAARQAGIPLSRLIASAAEREIRLSYGRRVLSEWQEEHGAFTPEELAAARAEIAAADLEYVQGRQAAGAA